MQIEGRNPVLEALRAKSSINKILLEKNIKKDDKISQIIKLANSQNIKIDFVKKYLLDKQTQTQVHQGVIALGTEKQNKEISTLTIDKKAFLIYIREALYEHNIGAIIRTAECAGATGIILPPKIELTPSIRRAAMGATEHIPITKESLFNSIKSAKEKGLEIVGIERDKNAIALHKAKLTRPILLIIGGEDRSLSEPILKKCNQIVQIPMFGKVNSLNMSVAAALTIYEVVRQNPR